MKHLSASILYVDDDSDDCLFLQSSLATTGRNVDLIYVPSGEEAITYLNSIPSDSFPALIVLDLNMPRWDGRRTLSYLKSQPHLSGIPVVMLSTSESKKEREDCQHLGAISYYEKPNHFDGYKPIVASLVSLMA